jgi:hypothetical protein
VTVARLPGEDGLRTGRRPIAGAVIAFLAAGLYTAVSHPAAVQATTPPPDSIATYAGGAGSGAAALLGQKPYGVAIHGSTLYIADQRYNLVRAVNLGTGQESIFAGGGTSLGDGGPATSASLVPFALATDAAGDVFVTDTVAARVRKIDLTGTITTVAGNGTSGFSGDGGAATSAMLASPEGVAIDASGNLFIGDTSNQRIRKVDTLGKISTFAGNGTAGKTGDGAAATSAELNYPTGVAVDGSGNVFIADTTNSEIREVSGGTITRFAGGGTMGDGGPATSAFLAFPQGVAVDGSGNVFIADTDFGRVRVVHSGTINLFAGSGGSLGDGGLATSAELFRPVAIAFDASANVFIADNLDKRVRRVDHTTLDISTEAGLSSPCGPAGDGGQALAAQVCAPASLAFDAGNNLYLATTSPAIDTPSTPNGRVRKITPAGVISTVAGGGAGCTEPCAATSATLGTPTAVAIDSFGDLFIATGNEVKKVDNLGMITTFAGTGVLGFSGDGGAATSAELSGPGGVAVDSSGNVFVSDSGNARIRKVDHLTGVINTIAGNGSSGFSGDGGPATAAQLWNPSSIAVDGAGTLYISDTSNSRIRRVAAGIISTYAGIGNPSIVPVPLGDGGPATSAWIGQPGEIYFDGQGDLFIANYGNSRIRVIDTHGIISTIAGCTAGTSFPDPSCPTQLTEGGSSYTSLNPTAVAVDSTDDIFVSEGGFSGKDRILRVQAPSAPSAPTGISAVGGDATATISWSAPASNGGNPISRYKVIPYQGPTPLTPVNVLLGTTHSVVVHLPNNHSYTFTVTASNAVATSAESVHSNTVVLQVAPPGGINTHAGSAGSGASLSLGQVPFSIAAGPTEVGPLGQGSPHLYIGDFGSPVIRDVSTWSGNESVLAGNAAFGYAGDGHAATAAMLNAAGAIAYCGPGQTYFADTFNYAIRLIDGSGHISTIAGTGRPGYSGDGGPATLAQLGRVFGIACRAGGGLYVADSDNGAVRIIDGAGGMSTWWFGFSFPTGIVEMSPGQVAVSDAGGDGAVWYLNDTTAYVLAGTSGTQGFSGDGGPATSAKLDQPFGLAFLYGTLYIADTSNHRVRAVSGGTINTFAGNGTPGSTGDGGAATSAELSLPTGVVVGTFQGFYTDLYIADSGSNRVRAVNVNPCFPQTCPPTITTLAGNGTPSWSGDGGAATMAQLGNPFAIAIDGAGNQYIADDQNGAIRRIDTSGIITTVAGTGVPGYSGDGGLATSAQLNDPRGVSVDAFGNIFIADSGNQRIRKVDHSTGKIQTVAGTGIAGFSGDLGAATSAQIHVPWAIVVDGVGNVFFTDTANNRVRKFTVGGSISTVAGSGSAGFSGEGGPAIAAMLNGPRGLALDGLGNLFISDSLNHRVRKVDHVTGFITTVAGTGTPGLAGDGRAANLARLNLPNGIGFDVAGNLFIADELNQRIRMVNTLGIISSVVATCGIAPGFAGDGGPAATALVNYPFAVAVDSFNNLYIADVNNNRVRAANGLEGIRPGACPAPIGTPGSRTAGSSSGSPGPRIDQKSGLRIPISSEPLTKAHSGVPVRATAASPAVAPPASSNPPAAAPTFPRSSGPVARLAPQSRTSAATVQPVATAKVAAGEQQANPASLSTALLVSVLVVALGLIGCRSLWRRRHS